MSPHAVTQQDGFGELLASFGVTKNGFLPAEEPLERLASPYYAPWELLIHNLRGHLSKGALRQKVEGTPVLSTDQLRSEAEWRRAYVILTLLTHSYVWGGEKAAEVLPPPITVPLLSVSAHLEVPPVATYAALNLWNFTSSTADFTDLDSLASPHTFTGTPDESWFLCVSVAMEAQGAPMIPVMLRALSAIPSRDWDTMTSALDRLAGNIRKVGVLLDRMRERCDPMVFYHRIRPFLAGSKNMAAAGLPRGVRYDEGGGRGSWQQWRGGSNGQSSLIQFWDVVLGVTHAPGGSAHGHPHPHAHADDGSRDDDNEQQSFHDEVRAYMPGGHRRFLEHAARSGSLRALAMAAPAAGPGHERMQAAYAAACRTLAEFRTQHLGIVTAYIVIPSKKPWAGGGGGERTVVNLATASTTMQQQQQQQQQQQSQQSQQGERRDRADRDRELTGTGGTALLPFLKQSRDETSEAGEMVRERMGRGGRE